MKKIYFVRHGESEANVKKIIAGGEFESPLTEKGKEQAKAAGRFLRSKNIELIVSSPMERTIDTATIIANEIGMNSDKILKDVAFTEVFNKYYSGKSYALRAKHIEEGKLRGDIEAPDSVYNRVKEGLARLKKYQVNNVLIVSHGGTGRMIRAITENIPHHDFMGHTPFGNTEIYEFNLE